MGRGELSSRIGVRHNHQARGLKNREQRGKLFAREGKKPTGLIKRFGMGTAGLKKEEDPSGKKNSFD